MEETYEIDLPATFDVVKFEKQAMAGLAARGKFWMACLDHEPDIWRFKGIMHPNDQDKPSIRLFIDVTADGVDKYLFVTTPQSQALSPLEVAREVRTALGGTKMYKDGVEVS